MPILPLWTQPNELRETTSGAFQEPRDCAGCVALPLFSHILRGICGTATFLAHFTWDAWHCHSFRAADVGCVALPRFSCISRGVCGTATFLVQLESLVQRV